MHVDARQGVTEVESRIHAGDYDRLESHTERGYRTVCRGPAEAEPIASQVLGNMADGQKFRMHSRAQRRRLLLFQVYDDLPAVANSDALAGHARMFRDGHVDYAAFVGRHGL